MIASKSQNQLQSFLAPLGDLLKALMFLSNLNGLNSSPSPLVQRFNQRKGSSKVWKEKGSKWFYHFSLYLFLFLCVHYLCVLLSNFESVLFLYFALFNLFLFVFSFDYFVFNIKIKNKKNWKLKNKKKKIQKQCVLCVHWYLCTLDGHWNKVF